MKIKIKTKIPGPRSKKYLDKIKKINGGRGSVYPYVHSGKGEGCYFQDLDKNTFLDFGCQIACNPLGYNHPQLLKILSKTSKIFPTKYAGQDFVIKEHLEMLEEILSITPKKFNTAFLINSGAEAVENSLKISLRKKKTAKLGISFENAFHGRTLGALSCTNSKSIQKKNFFNFPMRRLPFNETGAQKLLDLMDRDCNPEDIGFIIVEAVQGEGGYWPAPKKLLQDLRKITKKHNIPLICDEVQAGMGRTGKWWAFEHYKITPDIMSSAKALQVGAVISSNDYFPKEESSISSTWGGGDLTSLAIGVETIKIIKKQKLLNNVNKQGNYLRKALKDLQEKHPEILNIRGLGLMNAFDLPKKEHRDKLVLELATKGIIVLGCGPRGIRLIPPYIVKEKQIDEFIEVLGKALDSLKINHFKQKGNIQNFIGCGGI